MIGAPRIPEWNDEEALNYLYGLEQNIYETNIQMRIELKCTLRTLLICSH